MIKVNFYTFYKKFNSTQMPDTGLEIFDCTLKEGTNVLAPTIQLKTSGHQMPTFTYCFIPALGNRYYFIKNVYWDMGLWTFDLEVDVLATYRTAIRNSSQYIVRSSSLFNDDLVDTMYPTVPGDHAILRYTGPGTDELGNTYDRWAIKCLTEGTSIDRVSYVTNYFRTRFDNGMVCVGIIGSNTSGVTYYAMYMAAFKEFISKAFSLVPSDMTDVSSGVANAIYDPIQYITSCRWYPCINNYKESDGVRSIKLGGYTATVTGANYFYPMLNDATDTYYVDMAIPKHPRTSEHAYLNMPPFTELAFYYQPFGLIPIDPVKVYGKAEVRVAWEVDYGNGIASIKMGYPESTPNIMYSFYVDTIEYGVPLPISALVTDWKTGAIASGIAWLKNTSASKMSMPDLGFDMLKSSRSSKISEAAASADEEYLNRITANVNTNVLDKMIDGLAAAMGQVKSVGAIGSFIGYCADAPEIFAYFYDQTDEDPDRFGKPYYAVNRLSNLSLGSFVVCRNATVTYTADQRPLAPEADSVALLLNTGVYLE